MGRTFFLLVPMRNIFDIGVFPLMIRFHWASPFRQINCENAGRHELGLFRRLIKKGLLKRKAIEHARLIRLRPGLDDRPGGGVGIPAHGLFDRRGGRGSCPLATVIFFGIITDTILTMLVLPVLYLLFGKENQSTRNIFGGIILPDISLFLPAKTTRTKQNWYHDGRGQDQG